MALVIWVLPGHHFQTITVLVLYITAVLPNLLAISSIEDLIMAWFDSIFIYILFSAYIGFLVFKWLVPKGVLGGSQKEETEKQPLGDSKKTVNKIMKKIERDVETYTE